MLHNNSEFGNQKYAGIGDYYFENVLGLLGVSQWWI
jgi:hypothetical protein